MGSDSLLGQARAYTLTFIADAAIMRHPRPTDMLFSVAVALARQDAKDREIDAAYGAPGGIGDEICVTLDAWLEGVHGAVPPLLEKYFVEAGRKLDPEWDEYNRLRKKFE